MRRSLAVNGMIAAAGIIAAAASAYMIHSLWPTEVTSNRRLAPPGTFFLLNRVSVTTDSGITGYEPGTKVKYLSEGSEGVHVIAGDDKLVVSWKQLTNDLDIVAGMVRRDHQSRIVSRGRIQERFNVTKGKASDRAELARLEAELKYLQLDKLKLQHALTEPQGGAQPRDLTLANLQTLEDKIVTARDRIEEWKLKIESDEAAAKTLPRP